MPNSARSPVAYRNLKTLPSKPNEAVFRLHVNQLEVRENTKEPPVNTKQAQGNWHAPLVLERYGMGNTPEPNAPTPMDGVEGLETPQTSYVPQRGESLSLRVAQVTLRTPPASSRPETKPVPAHATVSPSNEAPSEVASTSHLGSESSRYHSLLDEVKEEDFGRLTERYNELDDVADEILALNDKHDALSGKVDGVLEGTQELLEEVQSIKDNLSTMMGNMNSCQTSSDSFSQAPKNTGIPKRRREESLVLARSIRSYLAFLLGLEEACEAQILTSVTVDEANSPWNMSAANVFVAAFEQFQGLEMDLKILTKKPKNKQKSRNTQKRQQMRKRTLFTQRYDIALQDPRLQRHLELLGRLGVDGMSSDESDEEDGSGPVFRVRRPN
ncbi:hypothetical protein BDN71DRAFT_1511038 [Pleurotus eryngii]|uniref:Uncharacterized protein n=1 Tax=Pleurotus eryngii TaxID=5323 RepID=A0A9P6DBH2_PLEER|nr:hypothetical protein BDN71DRAFT_1511038 [Pleurotus eryngii]